MTNVHYCTFVNVEVHRPSVCLVKVCSSSIISRRGANHWVLVRMTGAFNLVRSIELYTCICMHAYAKHETISVL